MGMTYSAQKPCYRFGPPRGKTAPQYKGTKAVSDYPFGKRLIHVIAAKLPKPFVLGLCGAFRTRGYSIGLFFAPFFGFRPHLDANSALGRLSLNGGFSFSSNQFPLKREAEGGRPSASENLRFWETQHSINNVKYNQNSGKRQLPNCLP
jgi:hypothetical protein